MNIMNGNLIELAKAGNFDLIIHGCNCFCKMGAGIAKTIANEFPEAKLADLKTEIGNSKKLGNYSFAHCKNGLIVINAYTQFNYGYGVQVNYNAVNSVFSKIKQDFSGLKIAYPKIGAGLAGGNWNKISKIIDYNLLGENHTLVVLQQKLIY